MTCAGGEGFAGAINFHPSGESPAIDLTGRVHLLPCSIKQDGPCPVSHYFKPRKTDVMVDDLRVEEAFFRGRKLEGVTIPLPQGYRGYVLDKKRSGSEKCSETTGGGFGRWVSRAEFTNLTYWNHDNLPSSDDLLPRCFHWFPVANAYEAWKPSDLLHKPVTEEELASATSVQTTAQK
ncbi:hypothetical protein ZIOFF_065409 [Zingiber officinale]|uniref:Uncharacterized protein n=1 Tax=Zingiber officinale TaxID=94328 RepID=A0A8J5F0J8_ZINOF|nr:hypothetical protein ZIOFF_065409 [Zingiber officinale]